MYDSKSFLDFTVPIFSPSKYTLYTSCGVLFVVNLNPNKNILDRDIIIAIIMIIQIRLIWMKKYY